MSGCVGAAAARRRRNTGKRFTTRSWAMIGLAFITVVVRVGVARRVAARKGLTNWGGYGALPPIMQVRAIAESCSREQPA